MRKSNFYNNPAILSRSLANKNVRLDEVTNKQVRIETSTIQRKMNPYHSNTFEGDF